ncbi:MAG: HEAT repeat domain-containing protein [Planctomycetes bacterium]|nr:HEAT repeat domain-containing protein [Planctomycetota bacterium]
MGLPDARDREGLLRTLRDETDYRALRWAVFHLVNRHELGPEEVAHLIDLLGRTEDPDVVRAVLWGLAASRDPEVVPVVAQMALSNQLPSMRIEALRSLAALEGKASGQILREILVADSQEEVRAQAAAILGLVRSSDPAAVSDLGRSALSDPSPAVRMASIDALAASSLSQAAAGLTAVAERGLDSGERFRAREHLDRARRVAEANGGDLTRLFSEPSDPMTAGAEPSHHQD